jgi:hypothetical protein
MNKIADDREIVDVLRGARRQRAAAAGRRQARVSAT